MSKSCPFCAILKGDVPREVFASNDLAFCIADGYPVTDGHTLIIPRRHIGSFFEVTCDERAALFSLLDKAKSLIDVEFGPSSYNVGINDGPAAGQTVPHLHIHLIPRYETDDSDPRGGVRWVVPEKADYWSES
ncbi:HIT family protein [Microbulbifer agarilyticus]|uniref:HIT family protein n=1 Tax=Microbulbifer agarilyticus TaxID=260552 RepID=UPI0028F3E4DE|nr:HIT family protein [Microbulbifer agarilyticus]